MKECHDCIYAEKCTPFEKSQSDECDSFLDLYNFIDDEDYDEECIGDGVWCEMSWNKYTQTSLD